MPIFNAGPAPYPLDDKFSPTPTYKDASVPDYGFYFAVPNITVAQCPFDGCVDYKAFQFKEDIEKKHYLLMRYELLYKYKAGQRLAGEYYPVPWVLVPSDFSSDKVIDLTVSPYSIYDTKVTRELRKAIGKTLDASVRQIELSVPGTSAIKAYWGSGTDTTIDEKKLKKAKGQAVRILIPAPTQSAPYVSAPDIEHRQDVLIQAGSSVLGKLRLTFCKPLSQDLCFVRITQPTVNGSFEAKILSLSEIPVSLEDGTKALHDSLIHALKPYCIDIVPLNDAKFLDASDNVLISTQTSLSLGADLKPPPPPPGTKSEKTPEQYIDDKLSDALFSKLKTYKFTGTSGDVVKAIQKVIIVVILPFYVDEVTSGFTPGVDRTVPLEIPLRSYLYQYGKAQYDAASLNKDTKWPPNDGNTWTVTIDPIPNPYMARTVAHEVLHALQLRHTFLDKYEEPLKTYLSAFASDIKKEHLTEFGKRDLGLTPDGGNIFELMRDTDLNSAVVEKYLWGVLQLPKFNPQTPASPAPSEGWNFMTQLNEDVLYSIYETNDFMDYKKDNPVITPVRTGPQSLAITFLASPLQRYLFRYQWELARATVQYLSTYSP